MLSGMGEMNKNHDSPSRIARGLSVMMAGALSTALESGRYAASRVYGRTNTLAGLVARGLITPGRVHYLTDLGRRVMYAGGMDVALLDELHAEALEEDRARREWGPTPTRAVEPHPWVHFYDRSRHILTGVEIVTLAPEYGPIRREVRTPRWVHGRRLMETAHSGSIASALEWANRVAIPDALNRIHSDHEYALRIDAQRTARRNRQQQVHIGDGRTAFEGWTPEHLAKLASQIRSKALTAQAMAEPGSLAAAAEVVDKVVKTAQLAVLRQLAGIIDQRELNIPGERIPVDEVRHMLSNVAHQLRIEWP